MERKGNYMFLTGLLVITLLISVVGTTFSYFGATSRNVKGETTVQFSKGVVGYNEEVVESGPVNPGDVVATKTITVKGTTSNADNLIYKFNFNVNNNSYPDGALLYTVSSANTSSNGTTIQSSTVPVSIPTGANVIEVGSGSFSGPVNKGKHTYTITIYRSDSVSTESGDYSISGNFEIATES